MSTSCKIARMTPNGLQVVFVKADGYRSHMEPMLATFYNDPVKVNLLFNKGDLLSLHKEPIIPSNYSQIQNVKSKVAYDSLCYFFDITVGFNEVGELNEIGTQLYNSLEEYRRMGTSLEYFYLYNYHENCWYYGDKNKRLHKCQSNIEEAKKNITSLNIRECIQNEDYARLKNYIEFNVPVQCHISRRAECGKYYLTLGSRKYSPVRIKYDLNIPRQDTKQVIARCNTLQELFQEAINVLLSL